MKRGYWYILAATLLFSTMEITFKLVSDQYNPMQLLFLRTLIGGLVLLPFALRHLKSQKIKLSKQDIKSFVLTGCVLLTISMTLYQLSVYYAKASIVAALFCCNPVFTVPLAYFILKEKINKPIICALVISVMGVVLIMNPFGLTSADSSFAGIIMALLSSVMFAMYSVVGKIKTIQYGGFVFTCFNFLAGVVVMFIMILVSHIGGIATALNAAGLSVFANIPIFSGLTWQGLPMLLYISIGLTGFGYVLFIVALKETSAAAVSLLFFIKPALAPVLALLILGELIARHTLAGIVMIVIGSGVMVWANRLQDKAEAVTEKGKAVM